MKFALRPILVSTAFMLAALHLLDCQRTGKLNPGKYDVSDQEYSSQNYAMERHYEASGKFAEKHIVDHCLLMEMEGNWKQDGGKLVLKYEQMRNRQNCHDSLPNWGKDSAELNIPVRNMEEKSYESLLAASDGKPEKWLKWIKE